MDAELSISFIFGLLAIKVSLALGLDAIFGEARRWHPLVAFGRVAKVIEQCLNLESDSSSINKFKGALGWALCVLPLPVFMILLEKYFIQDMPCAFLLNLGSVVILYFCVAWKSLIEHAKNVITPLQNGDIDLARQKLAYIVSRDTTTLDHTGVCKGTVESTLENGSDGIFAPIFWFVFFGAPGVLAYRLANTLDAMWGYKNTQYKNFGFFSAKMDDVLNYVPARLVALSYSVLGRCTIAFRAWRLQAGRCPSPNGGPVMCAGAGALEIRLGGVATYHGIRQWRSRMGIGKLPGVLDTLKCVSLINRTLVLWLAVIWLVSIVSIYLL